MMQLEVADVGCVNVTDPVVRRSWLGSLPHSDSMEIGSPSGCMGALSLYGSWMSDINPRNHLVEQSLIDMLGARPGYVAITTLGTLPDHSALNHSVEPGLLGSVAP